VNVKFNVPVSLAHSKCMLSSMFQTPWDGHSTTDSKSRGKEALFNAPSHSGQSDCADQCSRYLGTLKHSVVSHFDNHSATNVPDILGNSQLNILYHLFPISQVTRYILQSPMSQVPRYILPSTSLPLPHSMSRQP